LKGTNAQAYLPYNNDKISFITLATGHNIIKHFLSMVEKQNKLEHLSPVNISSLAWARSLC